MSDPRRGIRWRLVLGRGADEVLGGGALDPRDVACDEALSFLYDREYGPERNVRGVGGPAGERSGGLEESRLTVPDWINRVHELFPRATIERIERDALERYQLEDLVTDAEALRRATPNMALLQAVLRTKHLMNADVLAQARVIVRRVVEQLLSKLAHDVRSPFSGALDRYRRSRFKVAKNFDAAETIRRNLAHYDPDGRRLVIRRPYFSTRVRRAADRWDVIVLVDQSGSMLASAIHAAVTAAIFHGIRQFETRLVLFDTSVVDLTGEVGDPVETLMRVQLGGGTDIGQALGYAAGRVRFPDRTLIVLITDFFEGAPVARLFAIARELLESGVTLLGLAALDHDATPKYDRDVAAQLVTLGAHVAAMTPGELAAWVAEKVRR